MSLTVSLIAVLIPLLFMADIVGRLFREFAVTLAVTIIMSAFVSLTLTPMMAARILKHKPESEQGRFYHWSEIVFNKTIEKYGVMLKFVLRHQPATILIAIGTLAATVYLFFHHLPKGFFPVQDTGVILGISEAPQSISFPALVERQQKLAKVVGGVRRWRVASVLRRCRRELTLRPITGVSRSRSSRSKNAAPSAADIIRRLQPKVAQVDGIDLYMQAVQDLTVENRVTRTQYQYTLGKTPRQTEMDNMGAEKLLDLIKQIPHLQVWPADQLTGSGGSSGTSTGTPRRASASHRRISTTHSTMPSGSARVSTIFTQLNQYHVVLERSPQVAGSAAMLCRTLRIWKKTHETGVQAPLGLASLA